MPSSTPLRKMERKRATAPFATGPARRPLKDADDSDDELPPPPHEEDHSGSRSSIFPALELYEEGDEDEPADDPEDEPEDDPIQSQLQAQEETESQERRRQQKRQQEEGEQSLGDLWRYMSDGENDEMDEDDEDEAVPVHESPEKPPPRKRRRKVAAEKPGPTRRSRRLGVTNVLEQMSAAIGRAQPELRAAQRERQQQEEEEEGEQEVVGRQQVEANSPRQEEDDDRQAEEAEAPTEEPEAPAEETRQQGQNEPREEEREAEMEEAAPEGTPERTPAQQQQDREMAAVTPSRISRRLRGRAPTTDPDAPEAGESAEIDANGAQPSTQRSAQTIQETPQATGDSGTIEVQSQGNDLNDDNDNDDSNGDAEALPRTSGSPTTTAPPVTTPLSIKTLNALLELMGSAGWTGKATWKIGLNWQHIDPGQFGPEPFTLQARNLLRQLGYLTDVYVQVPRPNAQRPIEFKNFDMRVQKKYLQDHDSESAALFSAIDGLVNGVCHDALQPLTTYAVETNRETVRFRWLLADDLVEFVIPKAVELLETVYALGGSLPDKELGVAAVYVPRNTVRMIYSTLYTARRVAGWIIRLETALAWELGYRADRRILGGRITYLEDDDFDYEAGNRPFGREGDGDADAPPPPVSVATKRRDRSRLKPLLNKLEDELGLAWVAMEHARTSQEAAPEATTEIATQDATNIDVDEDDPEWMPVEAAANQTPQTQTRTQTPQTQERRRPGRPRREEAEARKQERAQQEQQRQQRAQQQLQQSQQQQPEPERPETPLGIRRARAVIEADWDSSDDDNDNDNENDGNGEQDYAPAPAATRRVGESVQIILLQPAAASLEQAMVDINDDDDDDDDDDGDYEDDGQVDSPVMTTATAAAAAAVRQPTPPVVSVEQETQDMIVVETSEPEEEVEEEEEEEVVVEEVVEAAVVEDVEEVGEEDDQAADAMQVEAEVEVHAEAPATPAADIPTPAPTPTPTPTPERAVSAAGPRPYVDTELKQILARLRTLKGTAQLDLVKLAADLNRGVFDVANRAEGIKSVIRAKLLRDKKPVPHWAQAGYTIR